MSDAGYDPNDVWQGERRHAPAAMRNREPIAERLRSILPPSGTVLEIASGSGEHALFFAQRFPALSWQPSDTDPDALGSIAAWRADEGGVLANLMPPIMLDASAGEWALDRADAMLCINMLHISPWAASEGLFSGASRVLPKDAPLVIYGPFLADDIAPAPSNLAFDASLKLRNAEWGLRDLADVDALAQNHGFSRTERYFMPANNLLLVYRKNG